MPAILQAPCEDCGEVGLHHPSCPKTAGWKSWRFYRDGQCGEWVDIKAPTYEDATERATAHFMQVRHRSRTDNRPRRPPYSIM